MTARRIDNRIKEAMEDMEIYTVHDLQDCGLKRNSCELRGALKRMEAHGEVEQVREDEVSIGFRLVAP